MGFFDASMGAAALTYLILYLLALMVAIYIITQRGIRTRFTMLAVVCLIRIGAQLSGVGFAVQGWEHYQWLVAYLVLGAEGYFAIVLSAYHFVAVFEKYVTGNSFLKPKMPKEIKHAKGLGGLRQKQKWRVRNDISFYFHYMLIPANAILIAGGTMTIGIDASEWDTSSKVRAGKIMRVVGQSIFLAGCIFLLAYAVRLRFVRKLMGSPLTAVLAAGPFLLVRGVFGIVAAVVDAYNYYDFNNYGVHGLQERFLVGEYIMGTTMEYIATVILILSHFTSFSREEMQHAKEKKRLQAAGDSGDEHLVGETKINHYEFNESHIP